MIIRSQDTGMIVPRGIIHDAIIALCLENTARYTYRPTWLEVLASALIGYKIPIYRIPYGSSTYLVY